MSLTEYQEKLAFALGMLAAKEGHAGYLALAKEARTGIRRELGRAFRAQHSLTANEFRSKQWQTLFALTNKAELAA